MRRIVLALAAIMMLAACGTLQEAYDNEARDECQRHSRDIERVLC